MLKTSGLRWLWLTVIVLALDRLTKQLALVYLSPESDPVSVVPHFNLVLAFNRGAAFSFLGGASGWQVTVLALVAAIAVIVILFWLSRLPVSRKGVCVALALILGGALGNLCDRVLYAAVIDFLDVYAGRYHWPVFNIADSAICLGALWLVWDGLREGAGEDRRPIIKRTRARKKKHA